MASASPFQWNPVATTRPRVGKLWTELTRPGPPVITEVPEVGTGRRVPGRRTATGDPVHLRGVQGHLIVAARPVVNVALEVTWSVTGRPGGQEPRLADASAVLRHHGNGDVPISRRVD